MVNACVLIGIIRGQIGHTRAHDRPYLGADGRAHAVGEEVIKTARQRIAQTAAHVGQRVSVLIPLEVHVIQPFSADYGHVGAAAVLLDAVQVYQLQIQIVVFHSAHELLGITLYVHQLHAAFERAAQGTADVFAHPAGVNTVKKRFLILNGVHYFSSLYCRTVCGRARFCTQPTVFFTHIIPLRMAFGKSVFTKMQFRF